MSRKIRIRGRQYTLRYARIEGDERGLCDNPRKRAPREIIVDDRLKGAERAEVLTHELLHAAAWDLSEETVEETARDIIKILDGEGMLTLRQ